MRYSMQLATDPISSTALSLFDVTASTAYVEIHEDELVVQLGNLFKETFPLASLGKAGLDNWEWYMGLGLRTDFQGTLAPITSFDKVVSIPLEQPQKLFLPILGNLGMQVECKRLVFSVAEPDAFLIALNSALHEVEEPDAPEPAELDE
ncbi:MAG: hypothetical protein AB4040_16740 [Synechococcus sp.]